MPSRFVRTLKLLISVLLEATVMADVVAATGTPPLLPMSAWIAGLIVMWMNLYARSLFWAFSGTTHMLPAEPGDIVVDGNRNVPHLKDLASVVNRLYHQLPEKKIGYLPLMKLVPASSALAPVTSLLMYPLSTQSLMCLLYTSDA